MNSLFKIFIFILLIILTSCAGKEVKKDILEEEDIDLQMIAAYKEGKQALEKGDVIFAAKKFNEAEILFPQSIWAPRSVLMAAYSYYSQAYYGDAIFELERYLKTYPQDKNQIYAHYLIALSYYENIQDEKKDLKPLLKAKDKFQFVLFNYPNTDFALDAKFKLDLIADILASKEIYLANYYIKKEKWIPAINRLKVVISDYSETIYVEEALHRLVEIHYLIGLELEAKKYANVLGYNYLSSDWYKESYRVFNKDYAAEREKIEKESKKSIFKKLKTLIE
tara:strand:+ start:11986 stop:12825 length:840 start_codon:yes stop_codon:yes gene_type:complete